VADRRAATLPLGQQRCLEVGRALASAPSLLLLDEPSSGLDVRETDQLGEVLRTSVTREGIALLLVEHDLDLVLGLSSHIYVIDFGRLIFDGTPAQARRSESVQAAYLGKEIAGTPAAEMGT
jgi:ABC-type branched-subunit amino acid transport system ATPase component